MKFLIRLTAFAVISASAGALQAQQIRTPQPSQSATVSQTIGIADVTVKYSRPGVKNREVWGKVVPYDQMWRTGANAATVFETSEDIKIEGQKVAAGKYALFTIPGKDEWTLVINKTWNQGGTANYKQEEDVFRAKIKPAATPTSKEWMEFSFEDLTDSTATLALLWEKTKLPIKLEVATKDLVLTKGRAAVSWVPSMQFAMYCLQNNTNLDEAMKMIDVSISIQETYRNHVVKGRLLEKKGMKADAAKILEKAVAMGKAQKEAPFDLADVEKGLAALKPASPAKKK